MSQRILNKCRSFTNFFTKKVHFSTGKPFWDNSGKYGERENPVKRTIRVLVDDVMGRNKKYLNNQMESNIIMGFPNHADIVIIGGGAMGSSIAYWLKQKSTPTAFRVVVIEKDTTFSKCSTTLSVGGLRQQFSLPENIEMSLFGAEFLRTIKKRFGPEADVYFTPHGYLVLASEEGAAQLLDNSKLQKELGAVNMVLSKNQLKKRFPWMNVDDVELGCIGLEKEGWFDPWSLLTLLKAGAQNMGVQYIKGEVVDFMFKETDVIMKGADDIHNEGIYGVVVKTPEGDLKPIEFAYGIIAAGPDSGEIAKLAKIGTAEGIRSVPLPVERRKRYVFQFDCQEDPPGINTPMTIDYTGTYFRRDGLGGSFISGLSPALDEEPSTDNLEVDYEYFDKKVWPNLANRVPSFNAIKVRNAWSGFYEYNTFDENGIIGGHPYYTNLLLATGFSGHGIQQAPAVGRAIAELILDGKYQTIDLTRLGFDRLIVDKPMYEIGIY